MPGALSAEELILQCRVLDTAGQPVSGANAALRKMVIASSRGQDIVKPGSVQPLEKTDADGNVMTAALPAEISYVIEFQAVGFLSSWSVRSHLGDVGAVTLPDVVLRRLRTVEGSVTDAAGQPVAGVTLKQAGDGNVPTSTVSAADGSFRLEGVPEGLALVCAEHKDYWTTGRRAAGDADSLSIVLHPRTDSNPEKCDLGRLLPPSPQQSAIPNVAAMVNDVRASVKSGNRPLTFALFSRLCSIDPAASDELLRDLDVPKDQKPALKAFLIISQMKADFENGLASLNDMTTPSERLETIAYYLLPISELSDDQKRSLLSLAVTELRGIDDPTIRVSMIAQSLKHFHQLQADDIAGELIDDAVQLLAKAGDGSATKQMYGNLAEQLAPIDSKRALSLLKNAEPLHSAWVAANIANVLPEKAEEMIRGYEFKAIGGSRLGRWYCLPRVCYRMAFADPERAVQLSELMGGIVQERVRFAPWSPGDSLGNSAAAQASALAGQLATSLGLGGKPDSATDPVAVLFKAAIHGLIADAIVETNPQRARELIEGSIRAIGSVSQGARNQSGGFLYPPFLFMAQLVPTAARIDEGLAAEICWRALAMRTPHPNGDDEEASLLEIALVQLYGMLTSMDSGLASDLIGEIGRRSVLRSGDGETCNYWLPTAWLLIDPPRGQRWLDSLCDRGADGSTSPQEKLRQRALANSDSFADTRFGSTILEKAETSLNGILWLHVLLDQEELRTEQ